MIDGQLEVVGALSAHPVLVRARQLVLHSRPVVFPRFAREQRKSILVVLDGALGILNGLPVNTRAVRVAQSSQRVAPVDGREVAGSDLESKTIVLNRPLDVIALVAGTAHGQRIA